MKNFLFFLVFIFNFGFSQEDAWVYFNDKPDAATYFSNPLSMLTQRALDRRTAQGIALDNSDVPIAPTYINQVTRASGITVMAKSKWLNALHVRGSQSNIKALLSFPFVNSIEFANQTLNSRVPNSDTSATALVNKQMNIEVSYNYGSSANQIQMLNGHLLHEQNYTGAGKIIAVLDSGFINVNLVLPSWVRDLLPYFRHFFINKSSICLSLDLNFE